MHKTLDFRQFEMIKPVTAKDGAGVILKRAIGGAKLDYLDPFLLLDHFGSDNSSDFIAGFPMHPHRGIETVTYMIKGAMHHRDSNGNKGIINAGGLQWMTAGSGIIHEEMPEADEGSLEGFQLWINLRAKEKMKAPGYQEFDESEIPTTTLSDGTIIRAIAGNAFELKGAVTDLDPSLVYLDVELPGQSDFSLALPENQSAFGYVFRGSLEICGEEKSGVEVNTLLASTPGKGDLRVRSGENGARLIIVSAKPHGEPIERYGPFVMNTRQEIEIALSDLNNGTFIK